MIVRPSVRRRAGLTRERVLAAAVELADESGIEAVTMRSLARSLGVEAMALYNHVANKEALLDGMVEVVWGEINEATAPISGEWKTAVRRRILAAREVLLRHRWAPSVLDSRTNALAPMNRYFDSLIGLFRESGFSYGLTHHALHALGTRAIGYSHEPWNDSEEVADLALVARRLAGEYPNIAAMLEGVTHDPDTTLGGCDDQFEFELAVDLLLDGLERLRDAESITADTYPTDHPTLPERGN
jgi:AcrR family transcriptional regulator